MTFLLDSVGVLKDSGLQSALPGLKHPALNLG
jgi:hypothetical protein